MVSKVPDTGQNTLAAATEELRKAQEDLTFSRSEEGEQLRKLKKETDKLKKAQREYEESIKVSLKDRSFADLGKQLKNDILAPIKGLFDNMPPALKTLGLIGAKLFVGSRQKSDKAPTMPGSANLDNKQTGTTETIGGTIKSGIVSESTQFVGEGLTGKSTNTRTGRALGKIGKLPGLRGASKLLGQSLRDESTDYLKNIDINIQTLVNFLLGASGSAKKVEGTVIEDEPFISRTNVEHGLSDTSIDAEFKEVKSPELLTDQSKSPELLTDQSKSPELLTDQSKSPLLLTADSQEEQTDILGDVKKSLLTLVKRTKKPDSSKTAETDIEGGDTGGIGGAMLSFGPIEKIIKFFAGVGKFFAAIWTVIKVFASWKLALVLLLTGIVTAIGIKFWEPIKNAVIEIKDKILGLYNTIKEWFASIFAWGLEAGQDEDGEWSLWTFITNIFKSVKDWFIGLFSWGEDDESVGKDFSLIDLIGKAISGIGDFFKDLFDIDWGQAIKDLAPDWIKDVPIIGEWFGGDGEGEATNTEKVKESIQDAKNGKVTTEVEPDPEKANAALQAKANAALQATIAKKEKKKAEIQAEIDEQQAELDAGDEKGGVWGFQYDRNDKIAELRAELDGVYTELGNLGAGYKEGQKAEAGEFVGGWHELNPVIRETGEAEKAGPLYTTVDDNVIDMNTIEGRREFLDTATEDDWQNMYKSMQSQGVAYASGGSGVMADALRMNLERVERVEKERPESQAELRAITENEELTLDEARHFMHDKDATVEDARARAAQLLVENAEYYAETPIEKRKVEAERDAKIATMDYMFGTQIDTTSASNFKSEGDEISDTFLRFDKTMNSIGDINQSLASTMSLAARRGARTSATDGRHDAAADDFKQIKWEDWKGDKEKLRNLGIYSSDEISRYMDITGSAYMDVTTKGRGSGEYLPIMPGKYDADEDMYAEDYDFMLPRAGGAEITVGPPAVSSDSVTPLESFAKKQTSKPNMSSVEGAPKSEEEILWDGNKPLSEKELKSMPGYDSGQSGQELEKLKKNKEFLEASLEDSSINATDPSKRYWVTQNQYDQQEAYLETINAKIKKLENEPGETKTLTPAADMGIDMAAVQPITSQPTTANAAKVLSKGYSSGAEGTMDFAGPSIDASTINANSSNSVTVINKPAAVAIDTHTLAQGRRQRQKYTS